ncbi:MAG: LysR substrate-binding domain-containing protein [Polyangiales bacterium]
MRYDQLPPLAFLPTLETAGRLGSFKAAAEALHVTPSAVSQQVRAVEESLNVTLFERRGRAVVLTAKGELYLRDVRHALRELVSASERLHQQSERRPLRLDMVPFVAHEFLLPRVHAFRAAFPDIDLRISTNMAVTDLETSELDAAIRMGGGSWSGGVMTLPFGHLETTLVCSPALAREVHSLQDFANHTIIEFRAVQDRGLAVYLRSQGIRIDPARVQTFESYFDTVRAAEHGLGIAMGFFPLTTHWVQQGRLAVPLMLRVQLPGFISLVHRTHDAERFPYPAMVEWLRREYDGLPALPPGRLLPV